MRGVKGSGPYSKSKTAKKKKLEEFVKRKYFRKPTVEVAVAAEREERRQLARDLLLTLTDGIKRILLEF